MKKIFLIFVSIIVVIIGVYLYIRFDFLKAKDFKPDNSKSQLKIIFAQCRIASKGIWCIRSVWCIRSIRPIWCAGILYGSVRIPK